MAWCGPPRARLGSLRLTRCPRTGRPPPRAPDSSQDKQLLNIYGLEGAPSHPVVLDGPQPGIGLLRAGRREGLSMNIQPFRRYVFTFAVSVSLAVPFSPSSAAGATASYAGQQVVQVTARTAEEAE